MNASAVVFYVLSGFVLGSALLAVTSGRIFRSAIWLLFSLTGVAGLYFWMQMEFIAAVQIIVYVGGIVVLIIFSIFLTERSGVRMPKPANGRVMFSGLAVLAGFLGVSLLLRTYHFRPSGLPALEPSVANIGFRLLNTTGDGYLLPFELASLLLLAAMIGCIVIAIKIKPEDQ